MNEDLLTVREVAAKLGVAPVTVRKWCKNSKILPGARLETRGVKIWLIPASALKGVNNRRTLPGRPPGGGGKNERLSLFIDNRLVGTYARSPRGLRALRVAASEAVRFMKSRDAVTIKNGDADVTDRILRDEETG